MRIALGSDHRGSSAIKQLADTLDREGHKVQIMGGQSDAATDYPEPAFAVGKAIADKGADLGILICGTGIGMSIAANKVKGVRAAVAHDELTAQLSRSHNDANILCLSADLLGQRLIEKIVATWIATEFGGGRHARRIHKIEAIEQGKDPSTVTE
jgi:ribose 5-phosphate isomerase B